VHFGIYKRDLANRSRIVAAVCLGVLAVLGAIWLRGLFPDLAGDVVAAAFAAASAVGILYVANSKKSVDFLIETEAELAKVSWPTRKEFLGAAGVVVFTMFFLALYLFLLDLGFHFVLKLIGIY
jgi:preprotein translocase subunit SecE